MGLFKNLYEASANDSNNQTISAEKQVQSIRQRIDKVEQDIQRLKETDKDTKQLEMLKVNLYNQLAKAEMNKNNYKNRALQNSIQNNNKELNDIRSRQNDDNK